MRDRARWRRAGLPLAGALGGKIGVAADDQPLAGKIGCGNAGHVALVEQRELQGAGLQQRLDRRRAQGSDPVQAGGLDIVGDARLGDHAAIADQDHMVEVEALLEFLDLCRQRHRVGCVAVEDLDRNRAAVGGTEQAIDDLQRAAAAVAAHMGSFGQQFQFVVPSISFLGCRFRSGSEPVT